MNCTVWHGVMYEKHWSQYHSFSTFPLAVNVRRLVYHFIVMSHSTRYGTPLSNVLLPVLIISNKATVSSSQQSDILYHTHRR